MQLFVNRAPIRLYARILVIASGGYAGLFHGSLRTSAYGTLMGRYLEAGGVTTNLEFVFKHGYGKADLNALMPTEELPGAEVYDDQGVHVEWLERELFSGKGTYNHLEAFRHWRCNNNRKFYIDFTYQPLCRAIIALAKAVNGAQSSARDLNLLLDAVTELCRRGTVPEVRKMLLKWIDTERVIGFDQFNEFKPFQQTAEKRQVFRVNQIAYFSMGGIAHTEFNTNLPGVYVTGEAMHDFSANRIGGLPWGLYLIAGRKIADQCLGKIAARQVQPVRPFALLPGSARFDGDLLVEIQVRLQEHFEDLREIEKLERCLA